MERHCWLCDGPLAEAQRIVLTLGGHHERNAHRVCGEAWIGHDRMALDGLRAGACAAGHHRYPGRWEADPVDPYGDARVWHCAKGCGYIQRHPGYGVGRQIHELGLNRPVQPPLFADASP